jgi:hypothetical protein
MECTAKEFQELFIDGFYELLELQKVFNPFVEKNFHIDYVLDQTSPELIVRVCPFSFWEIGYKSDSPALWRIGSCKNWQKIDTAEFMEKYYNNHFLSKQGKRTSWQAHDLTDICDRLPID